MPAAPDFRLRLASAADISTLHGLIERSARSLQAVDYTSRQIEADWAMRWGGTRV